MENNLHPAEDRGLKIEIVTRTQTLTSKISPVSIVDIKAVNTGIF
jgi:hypothetical protein